MPQQKRSFLAFVGALSLLVIIAIFTAANSTMPQKTAPAHMGVTSSPTPRPTVRLPTPTPTPDPELIYIAQMHDRIPSFADHIINIDKLMQTNPADWQQQAANDAQAARNILSEIEQLQPPDTLRDFHDAVYGSLSLCSLFLGEMDKPGLLNICITGMQSAADVIKEMTRRRS